MNIKNYRAISGTKERESVLKILEKGIESVLPENVMRNSISLEGDTLRIQEKEFNLNSYEKVFVIGGGKASYKMAESLNALLKDKISEGYVNSIANKKIGKITVSKAGHPTPDEKGMKGVKKMLSVKTTKNDLVICLISGGGSAMMPLPQEGITLDDLKKVNKALLKAGASIYEINSVRKHLSQVSGGNLAAKLYPATIVSLIISDVIGDDLGVIASGPTAPDKSTFKDALTVLEEYGITGKIPKSIVNHLTAGLEGKVNETLKEGDKAFEKVNNFILANNLTALNAMEEEAEKLGFDASIASSGLAGEAKEAGSYIAEELAKAGKNTALIFGGETTVTVKGKGIGGRNQEMMLSMLEKINGKNITVASIGSDGIDYYKAAGAIADGSSYEKSKKLKLNIDRYLDNNDSYNFFKKMKDHIITGYTGTNVCDVAVGVKL